MAQSAEIYIDSVNSVFCDTKPSESSVFIIWIEQRERDVGDGT
jgi:hypothetical protein